MKKNVLYYTRIIILISCTELPCKKSCSNVVSVMMRCTASGSAEWLTEANFKQVSEKIQYIFCIHSLNHEKNKNLIKNLNSPISY